MIYLIQKDIQQMEGLSALEGNRTNIIKELVSNIDKDNIVIIDDLPTQSKAYEYIGLPYKIVMAHPSIPTAEITIYEQDHSRLIDFNSFIKLFNSPDELVGLEHANSMLRKLDDERSIDS